MSLPETAAGTDQAVAVPAAHHRTAMRLLADHQAAQRCRAAAIGSLCAALAAISHACALHVSGVATVQVEAPESEWDSVCACLEAGAARCSTWCEADDMYMSGLWAGGIAVTLHAHRVVQS